MKWGKRERVYSQKWRPPNQGTKGMKGNVLMEAARPLGAGEKKEASHSAFVAEEKFRPRRVPRKGTNWGSNELY